MANMAALRFRKVFNTKQKHFPCHEHRPLFLFSASLAKEAKSAPLKPSASLAKVDKSSGFRKKLNARLRVQTLKLEVFSCRFPEGKTTSGANGNLKSSVVRCRWERHLSCVFFLIVKAQILGEVYKHHSRSWLSHVRPQYLQTTNLIMASANVASNWPSINSR